MPPFALYYTTHSIVCQEGFCIFILLAILPELCYNKSNISKEAVP